MGIDGLLAGAAVGLVGGFTSGLLGVSPGGGLVVFSVLLLGAEQHVAQGISLAAQIPPTSLAGIRRYRKGGVRTPARWLAPLAVGFLVGGVGGAGAAGLVSAAALQWTYVVYLVGLDALLLRRDPGGAIGDGGGAIREPRWEALLGVGFLQDCRQDLSESAAGLRRQWASAPFSTFPSVRRRWRVSFSR